MFLLDLPDVMIEHVFSFLTYDEVAKYRIVRIPFMLLYFYRCLYILVQCCCFFFANDFKFVYVRNISDLYSFRKVFTQIYLKKLTGL